MPSASRSSRCRRTPACFDHTARSPHRAGGLRGDVSLHFRWGPVRLEAQDPCLRRRLGRARLLCVANHTGLFLGLPRSPHPSTGAWFACGYGVTLKALDLCVKRSSAAVTGSAHSTSTGSACTSAASSAAPGPTGQPHPDPNPLAPLNGVEPDHCPLENHGVGGRRSQRFSGLTSSGVARIRSSTLVPANCTCPRSRPRS